MGVERDDSGAANDLRATGAERPPLASSAALTLVTQVAAAVLSLGSVLIIARELGAQGRGEVVFLMAVATVVSRLAALGIQEANVNLASADLSLRARLATNSILFAGALGAAATGITATLFAVFPGLGAGVRVSLLVSSLASLPVLLLHGYLARLVQADWRFGLSNTAWILPPLANVTVNGALAGAGVLSVASAFTTWVGGQVASLLVLVWFIARRGSGFGRPDWAVARRAAGFGVRTHGGRIMVVGNYRLDHWILGALAGRRELGLYSVAVAWAEVLFYIPAALALTQRPDLVRAARRDAARRAAVAFRVSAAVTVAGAVALMAAAPMLTVSFFGEEFRGAVDDLRVLACGALGIVALKVLGNALIAQGRPLLETFAVGLGLAVTLALDFLLIPSLGGLGAAIASTAAYSVVGLAVIALFIRALGGRPYDLVPRGRDVLLLVAQFRALAVRWSRRP